MKIPYYAVIQYFELDINNCLMKKVDFAMWITHLLNDPKGESKKIINDMIGYFNMRIESGSYDDVNKSLKNKEELLQFLNREEE